MICTIHVAPDIVRTAMVRKYLQSLAGIASRAAIHSTIKIQPYKARPSCPLFVALLIPSVVTCSSIFMEMGSSPYRGDCFHSIISTGLFPATMPIKGIVIHIYMVSQRTVVYTLSLVALE